MPSGDMLMKAHFPSTTHRIIALCILTAGIFFFAAFIAPPSAPCDENRSEEIIKKIIAGEKIAKEPLPDSKGVTPPPKENVISGKGIAPSERKLPVQEKSTPKAPPQKQPHQEKKEIPRENIIVPKKSEPSGPSPSEPSIKKESDATELPPGEEKGTPPLDKKKKSGTKGAATADEALYKAGVDYFNAGFFEAAIKSFDELKSKHQQSPRLHSAMIYASKSNMRMGNFSKASEELSAIPAESGEYPASLYYLAESQSGMGKKDEAAATLYRLSTQFPQTSLADDALLKLSQLYLLEHKGQQALEAAVKIIRHYSDRETIDDAYFMVGQIYEKDPSFRDVEVSKKIYRIFIEKANNGEKHFSDSPLLRRVKRELKSLEHRYFRHER